MISLNREFKVVFEPKNPENFNNRRRFAISPNQLEKYVGFHNANTALLKAFAMKTDSIRVKLRKCGTIDFYLK